MHVRRVLGILVLLTAAPLVPACAVTSESSSQMSPDEKDSTSTAEAQGAFKIHVCKGGVVSCMAECYADGVTCGPAASHPFKPGVGQLFACVTTGRLACGYQYVGGDKCFYPEDGGPAFCA